MTEKKNNASNDEKIDNLVKKTDNLVKISSCMFIALVLIMTGITFLHHYISEMQYDNSGSLIDETYEYIGGYIKSNTTIEAIDDNYSLVKVNIYNSGDKTLMINRNYLSIVKITCSDKECSHIDKDYWCCDEKMSIYYIDEQKGDKEESENIIDLRNVIELNAGNNITLEFEIENKYANSDEYVVLHDLWESAVMS